MVDVKYANAMSEVLEYLKGIREEDIEKIPKKFLTFLEKNASKNFVCKFDYSKPLSELEISPKAKSIIGVIYYNFWCETEQQKNDFLILLNDNEKKFTKELSEKYNSDNIFEKNAQEDIQNKQLENNTEKAMTVKETLKWYEKLIRFIRKTLKK